MYNSESIEIVNQVMAGRRVTPLGDYLVGADRLVLSITVGLLSTSLSVLLLVALIKKPAEMALLCSSSLFLSFFLFCLFEMFPSLIVPLRLPTIDYYGNRVFRIPDETLGYRNTPLLKLRVFNVETQLYSPLYDIETEPKTLDWAINSEGFRDGSEGEFSDIVVIGDSFIEDGWTDSDTFGKRLEKHLPGRKVRSFGVAGYGPIQYLEVLKRYGIRQNAKVALFCFYEGNDIWNIQEYLKWKKDGDSLAAYAPGSKGLLSRYFTVVSSIWRSLKSSVWTAAELMLRRITQSRYVHPDIAVLRLPNGHVHKVLFVDKHSTMSTDDLLKSDDWQMQKQILTEFRDISLKHGITPMIVYIPTTSSVYAEYSTEESGKNWRRVKSKEVIQKHNVENAMLILSRDIGVQLLNLNDAFRLAASQSRMLYRPIDTHWNSEGKDIAAAFVANSIGQKIGTSSKSSR